MRTSIAHSEIRFLAFGDTDINTQGYDSDDEEGMLEYAKRFSMQQEPGTSKSCNGQEYDSDDEEAMLKRAMDMSKKGKEDTQEAMGSATESAASMPPPTDPDLPDLHICSVCP